MLFLILLLILIILIFYASYRRYENFSENSGMFPTRLFGMAKHVRLNKFNRVESLGISPPRLKAGETRCDTVLCPAWVPDDSICYKCI